MLLCTIRFINKCGFLINDLHTALYANLTRMKCEASELGGTGLNYLNIGIRDPNPKGVHIQTRSGIMWNQFLTLARSAACARLLFSSAPF